MKSIQKKFVAALALTLVLCNFVVVANTYAASLTDTYVRLSRMGTGNTSSVRLVFKTASAGATTLSIDFDGSDATDWTAQGGLVNATQGTATAACATETGATALPGTLSASGSGAIISVTGITALSSATTYCVDFTSASSVTNPTTAGEFHPQVTVGSDNITVGLRVVSGSTSDQIVVNATVPPTFNFVIGGCASNIDTFTTDLSPSSVVSTGGCTVTVNTNAKTGWYAWARSANSGLTSAAASKTIASVATGSTTTLTANGTNENYGFGVTNITQGSGAGTVAANAAYNATASGGANAVVGGLDSTLRQIASSNGTASGAQLTIKERAVISSLTPAANDYTDTITVVGSGNF